jgi:hypothetical protein
VALVALALLAPGASAQQGGARNNLYVDLFTSQLPGTGSGRLARTDLVNPVDPAAKPPAVARVFVQLHPGARFDTFAVPQCKATDADLMSQGAAACPPNSLLGAGELDVDTGFPDPGRILANDLTFINAPNELILLAREKKSGGYLDARGKVAGNTLDVAVPLLPGTPPDGGADTREILNIDRNLSSVQGGKRRHYLTTPPACPASGAWTNRVTFTFRDGVVQSYTASSPCRRAAVGSRPGARRPRIVIRGLRRRGCHRRGLDARVSIRDTLALRRAHAYLDGRRVRSTTRKRLRVRRAASRLRPGRHRLTVIVRDTGGRRARRSVRFRRCR